MPAKKTTAKPKRKTKSDTAEICLKCPATCCKDLAIKILKPRTKAEIEELKWHLHYDTVRVAIRHLRWYLVIKGRCIYLSRNNMCQIYDRRPEKCRKHMPPECERFGEWYDVMLETPDDLEEYLTRKS